MTLPTAPDVTGAFEICRVVPNPEGRIEMLLQVKLFVAAMVVLALQIANCRAELYVFGDSLSETGNFYLATGGSLPPSPLYYEGRFSNGRAWVEYFALALREPVPTPSILGGTNFAFNGARAAGVSPYGTPDLTQQVSSFLAASGGTADADDVFVVWAGANDIFFGASSGETDFIPNAMAGVRWSIETLHQAGARKIVVLDLPPLGQTPFFNTNPAALLKLNAAASAFNSELVRLTHSLRRNLPHARIADVKVSRLFQAITSKPRLFGMQNVSESATFFDPVTGIGYSPNPAADPNRYLFWDSVHPTAQGHKLIAAYALLDFKLHCLRR